ncbi:hypothetical protein IAD21_04520 [Abditibacteriota bacterium]|nr:hypothetical protein IAD21_04520 [Abditibacteriota bacterium]
MNEFDPRSLLDQIFNRLRAADFTLGLGELLAAHQAIEGGWGSEDIEELRQVVALLWCHSREELLRFNIIWDEESPIETAPPSSPITPATAEEDSTLRETEQQRASSDAPEKSSSDAPTNVSSLPVRAPNITTASENRADLRAYWPVSRRFMVYTWRYLRRPVPGGPADILDIPTTVQRVTQQGFFLAPIYRQRERNQAHLVLLIDQDGSMMPFHRFTRDLVETVRDESTIGQVDIYYFHNLLTNSVYFDPHLTMRVPWEQALTHISTDTSVLMVSDAGAARGYRDTNRIRKTTEFLSHLRKRTNLLAWLNPMPTERWPGTSAQVIAHLVPMFQMNQDGFSNAIDVVRSGPLHYPTVSGSQ